MLIRPVRKRLSEKNMIRRGIPRHFLSVTINDLKDYGDKDRKEVISFIRNYVENIDYMFSENIGIFLCGSNGVGKSFMASLIVKEAYRHRYTSKRCTFLDYINAYTKTWNMPKEEVESEKELFYHNYKAQEFLVLEEVGKEIDTKLSCTLLEDCLRYREERGLPTIICTNLPPRDLVEKYGASVGSLIKGNFKPIQLVGKDKRNEVFNKKI